MLENYNWSAAGQAATIVLGAVLCVWILVQAARVEEQDTTCGTEL